ncbi:MAG: hypothetical protein U9N56_01935 [Actinomycetota bacterium]|nr:hypothetical protein [Actinomycetota bacterium]
MWSRKPEGDPASDCPHAEVVTTDTAGFTRSACVSCGHVSLGFLHAMWVEEVDESRLLVDQD